MNQHEADGPSDEPGPGVTIGSLLRKFRKGSGRSQAQLADLLSDLSGRAVTRNEVSRWESHARLPSPYWQKIIASGLNVSLAEVTRAVSVARSRRRLGSDSIESAQKNSTAEDDLAAIRAGYPSPPRRLSFVDVEVMREMAISFRRMDNRFGGGHGRRTLEGYLFDTVERNMREGSVASRIRFEFYAAAAELYQIAGWMAYDTADQSSGRKFLRIALRLSQEVDSDALSAEILAAMSHQACFRESASAAVELALAAGYSARKAGLQKVRAEAAVMEAHGLSLQGDSRGSISALRRAEDYFGVAESSGSPSWLSYFDEAYLAARFGHVLRNLKDPAEAEVHARRSLDMSEGYERGRVFNMTLLAGIYADQRRIDDATDYADRSIKMSDGMRSARTVTHLRRVCQDLISYNEVISVRNLRRTAGSSGILIG